MLKSEGGSLYTVEAAGDVVDKDGRGGSLRADVVASTIALVLVALAANWVPSCRPAPSPREATASILTASTAATGTMATVPALPMADVPGADLAGLPRFPGAVRIAFQRGASGSLATTNVEYLTPVEVDQVREFYRAIFRSEDWIVADVSFSGGEWSFFVVQDEREASLTIEPCGPYTCIAINLSEPMSNDSSPGVARIQAGSTRSAHDGSRHQLAVRR